MNIRKCIVVFIHHIDYFSRQFTTFHTRFLRVVFSLITQRTLEIRVTDFGSSWRDGKAFCALVHNINPSLIDMGEVMHRKNRENLEFAFNVAEQRLGVPKLLDPEGNLFSYCVKLNCCF